jgi:hypothetical protein
MMDNAAYRELLADECNGASSCTKLSFAQANRLIDLFQEILGIGDRTFWRMVSSYELNPEAEQPRHPTTLDSYILRRSRRVRYDELAAYLARNNTYERTNAIDPRQMGLFG